MSEWRPVPGFDGYEVSSEGQVRSFRVTAAGRLLKPALRRHKPSGRIELVHVTMQRDGRQHYIHVHVLVAAVFIGPRPEGLCICHNDGDPTNNRVENLRYDTASSNQYDAVRHGTHGMASKTHCVHGHEYTAENTRQVRRAKGVARQCIACRNHARALLLAATKVTP